jgi:hypothetical protein
MKLLCQIAIRPNVAIESFFLPHRSGFPFGAIDLAASE